MVSLAATPRAEQWLRARVLAGVTPLKIYADNHAGIERHIRYAWSGESVVHSEEHQERFVATTFLVYVVQPYTGTGVRPFSWDLKGDVDRLYDALNFPLVAIQDGRRISGCEKSDTHYNPVWETDPVTLVEVQLGAYFRVYSSVEPEA